eukprot:829408-Rhodomonas_salina.1
MASPTGRVRERAGTKESGPDLRGLVGGERRVVVLRADPHCSRTQHPVSLGASHTACAACAARGRRGCGVRA